MTVVGGAGESLSARLDVYNLVDNPKDVNLEIPEADTKVNCR
ncbi:15632_t:CDS:2 [Entrophospora sp. SA101]|nr:15632_t:CDS:2 [Entrophospora sp. SA101]CAJ0824079.1 10909_t:CDS:2 [Entrophospora sp. SA101]CAJ0839436.1 12138_t:CDS:2 [Entrophospora sp. SA101]CAJ0845983.1 16244_t:CDS:2 [Entrophospora sp. SA101]